MLVISDKYRNSNPNNFFVSSCLVRVSEMRLILLYLPPMNEPAGKSIRKKSWPNLLLVLLPALLLAALFIAIAHAYDYGGRLVMMRYLLFAFSGLFAFILPYLSFPDPDSKLFQLGNLSGRELVTCYLLRHRPVWGIGGLLLLVTALADSRGLTDEFASQLLLLVYSVLFLAGIYLYAAYRYLKIGKDSQEWQEGERGMQVRSQLADVAKYPIDPGSIPSLINSVLISLIGMLAVVAGAMAYGFAGQAGEIALAAGLFLFGVNRYLSVQKEADRFYYQTNAFFSEFFGVASGPEAGREPLKVDQLWWIPTPWKAHSWGLMLQMDRKLPSGRYIAVGHLFIWVLAYQDAGATVMLAAWALFAVLHHGFLLLTATQSIAPKWWLRKLDRPLHWILGRFWVQVRWLLPMMLSMLVMTWFFGLFDWADLGRIAILYLFTGGLISAIISFRHERHWVH